MSIALALPERSTLDNLFARQRFIYDALCTDGAALVYRVGEELAVRFGERAMMKSSDYDFNVEEFAAAGLCELRPLAEVFADIDAYWDPDPGAITRSYD